MPLLLEDLHRLVDLASILLENHEQSGAALFGPIDGEPSCAHEWLTLGEVLNLVRDHLKEAVDATGNDDTPPF